MSHWIVSHEPGSDTFPRQDEWWWLPVWHSYGQVEENKIDYRALGAPVQNALLALPYVPPGHISNTRIGRVMGHLGGIPYQPGAHLQEPGRQGIAGPRALADDEARL